jgi:creatinine amidohydrolase
MSSVFRHGSRYILVLNGHGGNLSAIQEDAELATVGGERTVVVVNWWVDLAKAVQTTVLESPEGHAAEHETSEVMHVRPNLVDMRSAVSSRVVTRLRIISAGYRKGLYPSAVFGDPTKASPDKGRLTLREPRKN